MSLKKPYQTAPADPVKDLDQLPIPARYFDYQHVSSTRGCPGKCTFCGSPKFWGPRVRFHSATYFVDQLELLYQRGIRFFYFCDDTFTFNKKHVLDICKEIIRRKVDIAWVAISRVNHVDEEILLWMRKAGCTQISFGIESGSKTIRKQLNKHIQTDQVKRAFHLTRKYAMLPRAYFIYGSPGESMHTIQETIDLINDIKPLSIIFYILDIFPGTALYEDFKQRCRVSDDIWLNRGEDILYFETDPALSQASVLDFGRKLRNTFYQNLPGFVEDIEFIDDPEFDKFKADFCSRLGMTFSHGDYADVDAITAKDRIAANLYRKSLAYHPNQRAYLGLGIVYQKRRLFAESRELLDRGLHDFPHDPDLRICQGINCMNLDDIDPALALFLPLQDHTQVLPHIITCYRALGDNKKVDIFRNRLKEASEVV